MLRLLALTCLLLLAMLRLLDGSVPVRFESVANVNANVACEAVNTECRAILVAVFELHSEDAAAAPHHGAKCVAGMRRREAHVNSPGAESDSRKRNFEGPNGLQRQSFPPTSADSQ